MNLSIEPRRTIPAGDGGTPVASAASAALLDVQAVAALLNCSPRHVYRLSDGGKMPAPIRLGSLVRWPRQSLDAWLADGCKPVRVVSAKGGAK
jgi:excisionase family DNA binding protein